MAIDMMQLHPEMRIRWLRVWQRAYEQDLHIIGTQGMRSMGEQAALYEQGRSKPGRIVTFARPGYSWHNFGRAVDFAFVVNGKPAWPESAPWQAVGEIAESVGLEWGGRWKHPKTDRPHLQWTGGQTLASVRAGLSPADDWRSV